MFEVPRPAGGTGAERYWRLVLVLPPFVCIGAAALTVLVLGIVDPPRAIGVLPKVALMIERIAWAGVIMGTWPAYVLWAVVHLWRTRDFSAARMRRASWVAPLTFAPLCAAVWVAADSVQRGRLAEESLEPAAVILTAAVLLGYLSVGVAFVLEFLLGRVRRRADSLA